MPLLNAVLIYELFGFLLWVNGNLSVVLCSGQSLQSPNQTNRAVRVHDTVQRTFSGSPGSGASRDESLMLHVGRFLFFVLNHSCVLLLSSS